MPLDSFYTSDPNLIEIGIDEVGRGPMFGRVYSCAIILPKNGSFKHELMKDSKKFTSHKKLVETAQYIKENCTNYAIAYEDESCIDKYNIKNATHMAMHKAIKELLNNDRKATYILLVDGREFKSLTYFDHESETIKEYRSVCIEGGDNKYSTIAAASILAKVERDSYISELCKDYPKLDEYYDLSKNKGYGTAKHLAGIEKYGITEWHRKTFGICKMSPLNDIV